MKWRKFISIKFSTLKTICGIMLIISLKLGIIDISSVHWHVILFLWWDGLFSVSVKLAICGHAPCYCQWNMRRGDVWVEKLKSWVFPQALSLWQSQMHLQREVPLHWSSQACPANIWRTAALENIWGWWWTLWTRNKFCCFKSLEILVTITT